MCTESYEIQVCPECQNQGEVRNLGRTACRAKREGLPCREESRVQTYREAHRCAACRGRDKQDRGAQQQQRETQTAERIRHSSRPIVAVAKQDAIAKAEMRGNSMVNLRDAAEGTKRKVRRDSAVAGMARQTEQRNGRQNQNGALVIVRAPGAKQVRFEETDRPAGFKEQLPKRERRNSISKPNAPAPEKTFAPAAMQKRAKLQPSLRQRQTEAQAQQSSWRMPDTSRARREIVDSLRARLSYLAVG